MKCIKLIILATEAQNDRIDIVFHDLEWNKSRVPIQTQYGEIE